VSPTDDEVVPLTYTTYSKGGYGEGGEGAPDDLINDGWDDIGGPTTGLTIGVNDGAGPKHHARWTDVAKLRTALTGGGSSGVLTADTLNTTSLSGGNLPKQTAALTLNIAFSDAALTPTGFGDLYYHNVADSLDGKKIREILTVANDAIGGNGLPAGYTFGTLNDLVANLNLSFDNGIPTAFALLHLSTTP